MFRISDIGISVSVESSPRSQENGEIDALPGAPRKQENYWLRMLRAASLDRDREAVVVKSDETLETETESISPRIIPPQQYLPVARRLDFSSFGSRLEEPSTSTISQQSASTAQTSVGECNVCYESLPVRSNHVFTVCGHLFCVKCLLKWWDTASSCPVCRCEILKLDARDAVAEAIDSSDDDDDDDIERAMDAVRREWNSGSFARVLSGVIDEYQQEQEEQGEQEEQQHVLQSFRPSSAIPLIDRYLYTDEGIEWSSLSGHTNPDRDDTLVQLQLTQSECTNLRLNRELASILWARMRFNDTLLSNIEFTGETFHTFIWKQHWSRMSNFDIGQHRMFEFVMRRTASCNAPSQRETNFFGYISGIVIIEVVNPLVVVVPVANADDEHRLWENRHEYAFVVHVFCPCTSTPFGSYNIDEGAFETVELIFRFSDIRRMYRIMTCEISTW